MAYMFVSSVVMGAIRGSIGIAVLAMTYERRLGDTYIQVQLHVNSTVALNSFKKLATFRL